jgi:hypothetical protein
MSAQTKQRKRKREKKEKKEQGRKEKESSESIPLTVITENKKNGIVLHGANDLVPRDQHRENEQKSRSSPKET